jgi:hypothetical protein
VHLATGRLRASVARGSDASRAVAIVTRIQPDVVLLVVRSVPPPDSVRRQ